MENQNENNLPPLVEHHVVGHHHHSHLNSHHPHLNANMEHHSHHHHHHPEDIVEEENVESIVEHHSNHPSFSSAFNPQDYANSELVNYGNADPSAFGSDQSNYSTHGAFGPESDYAAYHVPTYPEEGKVEKKTEKDFMDLIADYVSIFDGVVYVEYEALMRRFQTRKRNYDHYKMSIQDVVERNGKKFMPIKEMVRFFESNGFTLHDSYDAWKRNMIATSFVHFSNKKDRKRKRNEVYDVSPLGLMSACDCQTSKLVPKKQRLAVKPLNQLTDTHYAKLRAVQLMNTIENLLSNLKQNFNDVFFYKATHDLAWFKDHLSRFYNSAPRCALVVREVVNEKKPTVDANQRTAVNTLKGLKEGGIISEAEGEMNHTVDSYSDIHLTNAEQ